MKRIALFLAAAFLLAPAVRAEDAAALYTAKCKMCHGPDGKGTPVGVKMGAKDLTATTLSEADIAKTIADGKGKMTPFKGKLEPAQIEAVAKFVKGGLK
jgi:mono/diheme cytochrome c family protein